MSPDHAGFAQAITEAANRAEATALLIRAGYRVYRPEADIHGEDMVVRVPDGSGYHGVQLKGGPAVDRKYVGHRLWIMFPVGAYEPAVPRKWFFLPHDEFYEWTEKEHGHTAGWAAKPLWRWASVPKKLATFLEHHELKPKDPGRRFTQFEAGGVTVHDKDGNLVDMDARAAELKARESGETELD